MKKTNKVLKWTILGVLSSVIAFLVGSGLAEEMRLAPKSLQKQGTVAVLNHVTDHMGKVIMPHIPMAAQSALWGLGAIAALWIGIAYYYASRRTLRAGEEHGSAKWAKPEAMKPFEDEKHPDNNIIMTQTEKLYQKDPGHKRKMSLQRNQFVTIVGGSGTGKTRFVVVPNILQANSSYVITDTKGKTKDWTGAYMQSHGYRVKVIDFATRQHTDHFNVFHYIDDEDDIVQTITTIMENTTDKNKTGGDQFFDKAERMLLLAIFDYLRVMIQPEDRTMAAVTKLIQLINVDKPDDLSPLDVLMRDFEKFHPDAFGVNQYHSFKKAQGKTLSSIVMSVLVRLSPFDVPSVRNLTKDDTLELETIGDEKTILYIVTPDQDSTYNFLIGMVWQTLYSKLVDRADNHFGGALPVPVLMIHDEFANSGKVPNFIQRLNTIRSRNISAMVILQEIGQAKEMYPKNWSALLGSADSFLYLGGHDNETEKLVSQMLGKQTIDVLKVNDQHGQTGGYSKSYDKVARDLMTPDEVDRLPGDKCIYMLRGVLPFLSSKFDPTTHPRYKELNQSESHFDYEPARTAEEIETGNAIVVGTFTGDIS